MYLVLGILIIAAGVIIYKMLEEKKSTADTQKKLDAIKLEEDAAAGEYYLNEDNYDDTYMIKGFKFGKTA